MLIDIQYDVNAHSHDSSIQKKKTETEKNKEREREVLEKNTRSKSAKTGQPAETHLQPTRRKSRQPETKAVRPSREMSSACQRRDSRADNMTILAFLN